MLFANVIIDLSLKNVDRTYQYRIPEALEAQVFSGSVVWVSFGKGNRRLKAVVIHVSETAEYDINKMKEIEGIVTDAVSIDTQMIALASWIRETYGGTMNDALRTVMPVARKVKEQEKKTIELLISEEELKQVLEETKRKKQSARERLLTVLAESKQKDYRQVMTEANVSASVVRALEEKNVICCHTMREYRNPIATIFGKEVSEDDKIPAQADIPKLNQEQQKAAERVKADIRSKKEEIYLLHGVTGSGKTEVYMDVIADVIRQGGQVIVLIPEIALTFQTVKRFYARFGERVSFLHSRLSQGERYDQYERAKNGEIDIMIGPRSALFTPFDRLSLIIMDEEHENSYKSESVPKYHARETAIARARMCHVPVILGSATPTIDSYYKAQSGEYVLLELKSRAGAGTMPVVSVVDLRQELKEKNYSIFSRLLKQKMTECLGRKEQIMLFINRRGYAGTVTCRSCGSVVKCPHCDVSMTLHKDNLLRCHYCGYEREMLIQCPECGSTAIGKFGTGTQKIEEFTKKTFPEARVLRMDMDTTKGKLGHQEILKAFSEGKADILVGTQMIVKGHDFPNVTLMGVIAADLSLGMDNYRAAETTFDLLVQASGRAGRAEKSGEVVIQTYQPEHYSVTAAVTGNYQEFYRNEILFRRISKYPPMSHMLMILIQSEEEVMADAQGKELKKQIDSYMKNRHYGSEWEQEGGYQCFGPITAGVGKIKDIYRRMIYIKDSREHFLHEIKNVLQKHLDAEGNHKVSVQFDYDPIHSY